jgi:SAM-dependent methyltransferase
VNGEEFEQIARVARDHWWYRTLHAEVLRALPTDTGRALLDVGAGAGVMLEVVRAARPSWEAVGVEPDATGRIVAARSGVELEPGSFADFGIHEGRQFDAITSLDSLYYLETDERIREAAERIARHLRPDGVWIGQVAAFPSLRGEHDAWVACTRRFRGPELAALFASAGFSVEYRYRYQLLSPLVWLSRRVLEPMRGPAAESHVGSDITLPSPLVNGLLRGLVGAEDALARGPLQRVYGSSVFWVARKVIADDPGGAPRASKQSE